MLSCALKTPVVVRLEDLANRVQKIKDVDERALIEMAIYKKNSLHCAKVVPFDYNWILKKEFEVVLDAVVKLSEVLFVLRNVCEGTNDIEVRGCQSIVEEVYRMMREALRELGCKNPPYKTGTHLAKEDVLTAARVIVNTFIDKPC